MTDVALETEEDHELADALEPSRLNRSNAQVVGPWALEGCARPEAGHVHQTEAVSDFLR